MNKLTTNNISVGVLPEIIWMGINRIAEKKKMLLITNKSILKISKDILNVFKNFKTLVISGSDKKYVDSLINKKFKCEVIYAVGSGKTIDIARYLAFKWNLEIICIPTIISTDAFLVDCTGLRENGGVTYVPSKKADKIIIDINLIKKAEPKYNLSGCGDVLSIYTALYDWKKFGKNYLPGISSTAKGILDGLISEAKEIKKVSHLGLEILITQLAMEVQLCYLYGNSRPEEGGEHFFVYCLENRIKATLHGEMVCFGILLTSFIQGQPVSVIKNFMDKVGINYKPQGLTKLIVMDTLREMPAYVKKHNLPESIYNHFSYEDKESEINNFISTIL